MHEVKRGKGVYSVAWSADGNTLAVGSLDKTIALVNAQTGEVLSQIKLDSKVYSVAISPDNRLAAGLDKKAAIIDVESGRVVREIIRRKQVRRGLARLLCCCRAAVTTYY